MSKSRAANTHNATDALSNMDELVKRREAINGRINEIKDDFGRIFMEQSRLNSAIRDVQDHLRGCPEDNQRYAEKRQSLKDQLQKLRQDQQRSEERSKVLNDELGQLQTVELPSCMANLSAEDVLEHHRQIGAANAEVNRIQSAIDAQHQQSADALASIPSTVDRQAERHNLMADIALGKAHKDVLEKLDAEIATDKKTSADAERMVAPQIADAKATVAGLGIKLKAARDALNALESKSEEVAHRYYVGEAQKAAAQYVNHALELSGLHFLLLGLNSIISGHDGIGIVRHGIKPIHLPMFRLPQFDGVGCWPNNNQGMILDGDFIGYGDEIQDVANAEKAKFDAILGRLASQ
jgi:chromosome segregation ATPase